MSASPQSIVTLGCRLNIAESEAIRQLVHATRDGRPVSIDVFRGRMRAAMGSAA